MKTTKIAMTSMVVLGLTLTASFGVCADAVEKSIKSQGDVSFKVDDEKTPPVDPTDPDKPLNPLEPGESTNGPLSIDHVSNLHFGEQLISAKTKTYYANLEKVKSGQDDKEVPNYVQVSDKRGSNEGWTLTVKQDQQFTTPDGVELKAAVLKLSNALLKTTSDNKANIPTPNSMIELVPGGKAVDVVTAKADEGMGLWVNSFGNDTTGANSVSLEVLGTSAKQAAKYSTTLTWTLSSTVI